MAKNVAHLLDYLLPPLPVRQWVFSLPKRLRSSLQNDREALNRAVRIFLEEIERHLRAHSPGAGPQARAGAVAFIPRFGSSLNLHTHFEIRPSSDPKLPSQRFPRLGLPQRALHPVLGDVQQAVDRKLATADT